MKKNLTLRLLFLMALSLPVPLFGQSWSTTLNGPPAPLYMGTNFDYPLRIYTNGLNRMQINGSHTYNINNQGSMLREGFVGIGHNYTPAYSWSTPGPYSLLHLNGYEGTFMQALGYRNWMKSGITITANNDIMYIGPRRNSADDVTDAMITWGDNATNINGFGPDNLLISFMTGEGNGGVNELTGNAPNGREIMRFTGYGNVGLGPRFSNTSQPQSQFHINTEDNIAAWLQISNQSGGQLVGDGVRMGYYNNTGYLYNQENAPFIFSTNANTVTQLSQERMRLTHIGAAGMPSVPGVAGNSTRLALSLNPATPLTQPNALVHIGSPLSNTYDGIRNWMNVGYLATHNSDVVYLGLKDEGNDRQDAVIAWGDNQTNLVSSSGPDNLRFVFTSSTNPVTVGTPEAKSANGQEVGRFTPIGQLGIGNFSPGSGNGPDNPPTYINATLDVNGDARIRSVQNNNNLNQVLVRDPNDLGRVLWRDAGTLGGGNGLGNNCGTAANPLTADREVPMNNNDLYFTGASAPVSGNTVNIGIACNSTVSGKLNVLQSAGANVSASTDAGNFMNSDIGDVTGTQYVGVRGVANGKQSLQKIRNIGGSFFAENSIEVTGVYAEVGASNSGQSMAGDFYANGTTQEGYGIRASSNASLRSRGVYASATNGSQFNIGGEFNAISYNDNTPLSIGVQGSGSGAQVNIGGAFAASYPPVFTPDTKCFGVYASVATNAFSYPTNAAIAVYGRAGTPAPGVSTYAGFFDGDVYVNGPVCGTGYAQTSDARFKTGVTPLEHTGKIIEQLQPKSYQFIDGKTLGMNFPKEKQYGFIAQEIEKILPELVQEVTKPAIVDQDNKVLHPEVKYKSVNYIGLIALLVQDAQERNAKMEQLTQQVEALTRLVHNCCTQSGSQATAEPGATVIQTQLQNNAEPTLGQNIPNPFDSETRIPVYLPQQVQKAEITFYGNDGRVLQSLSIRERGNVWVAVATPNLTGGIYSYTLFTDGRPIATRKMVKN